MPRKGRAQRFLFDPHQFVNDEAVLTMSLEAAGAYIRLFCRSWDMPSPGVLPDHDPTLAALSQAGDRWPLVRDEVLRAFDRGTFEGHLTQRGLVATHLSQSESRETWRNKKRRQRMAKTVVPGDCLPMSPVGSGSGSSPSSGESENLKLLAELPLDRPCPSPRSRAPADTERAKKRRDWAEAFERHFWPAYPRKVKRSKALLAWQVIGDRLVTDVPSGNRLLGAMLDALDEAKASKEWTEEGGKFIPHPTSWLNGRRWEDESQ